MLLDERLFRVSLAFHTGLLVSDYFRFPPPPYRGNRWHLNFIVPPTELPMGATHFEDKIYPAKEVVIFAEAKERAQRAADLIHAARLGANREHPARLSCGSTRFIKTSFCIRTR